MSKKKEIQKKDDSSIIVMKDFLKTINKDVMSKKNCKFCQSKFRAQAEEYYEQYNKSIAKTKKFLDDHGECISYKSVRNHLIRHYIDEDKLECLRDYGEDLGVWIHRKADTRQKLSERAAILEREMITLAALTDHLPIDERRRTADVLKKLSDGITGLEEKMDDFDRDQEPVEILIDKLRNIIAVKIGSTKDDDTKEALIDVVEKLSEEVSELVVEQK